MKRERRVVAKLWLKDPKSEMGFADFTTFFIARAHYEKLGRVVHSAKNNDGEGWDKCPTETELNSSEQ